MSGASCGPHQFALPPPLMTAERQNPQRRGKGINRRNINRARPGSSAIFGRDHPFAPPESTDIRATQASGQRRNQFGQARGSSKARPKRDQPAQVRNIKDCEAKPFRQQVAFARARAHRRNGFCNR